MKSSKVLLKAMDIIATPDKWTKGSFARDSAGGSIPSYSKEAVCFCSIGALNKTGEFFGNSVCSYLRQALPPRKTIVGFNDARKTIVGFNDARKTTHTDVIEKFMTATFLALADGQ